MALPVKALKVGQESYWLDQIARDREEYFSGRGESPGRFVGGVADASGLEGVASAEQVRAMFRGLDPATGEVRCQPLWRADPRSKLSAAPLRAALTERAAAQGVEQLDTLATSKALAGDIRAVQAACKPGASGRIKAETVERISRKVLGVDPRTLYGEHFDQAWAHKGKRIDARVASFDHCFSSPKSVSLLAAGGGDHVRGEVAAGRAEALTVAVGYLEQHGIGVRRDHNGADRHKACGGLLGVAFEHRMSRAGDPNAHTHVLVQNAAKGPDGRWTALDSDRLYAHLMAADHLYLAAERAALTERLGVRWTSVDERSGAAEIVGLDERALIERFSKRSEQIDDWLSEHGLSGIKASSAAAVATRAPKDHSESEESVYARWQRELADAGIGERELSATLTGGRGRLATPEEVERALTWLASAEGLTASASTFTRADVVDALAKRLPVAPTAQDALTQAETIAERFLDERSVMIGRDRRLGVERYSTPELLERERAMVAAATERREERAGQVRPEIVQSVLDRHQTAGDDQAAMVQDVTRSGAGVSVVVGRAGSGKTWALGLAREAFELDGRRVIGTAPTGIAAVGLGDEGFSDIRTADRLLFDLDTRRAELDAKSVLVVDEAAMLGTRKLARLLDHAHPAGAKVVLVGDDRQFAAIEAGGGFRALRLRLGASELTQNRRQIEAWERHAIDDLRAGRIEQAIAAYAEHDRIRAYEGRDDRDRALVGDWWQAHQAGEQPVIYAHRRAQVDQLNTVCQRLRAEHGQLGTERLAVGDRAFAVGDQVVLGANALDRLGVANGTSAEITALDVAQRTMTIRILEEEPPRTVTLPAWYLDAAVRPGQSRRVDLAYARTDMRSQGRTEQRALLALDGKEDMQGGYVQLTRGKERTDMYLTVGPEPLGDTEAHPHPRGAPVEPEALLGRVLTRDGSKTLATDTPVLLDMRRMSTKQLREERDRLAELRAECPADRSRELGLARQRAAELDTARRAAVSEREAAAAEVARVGGSVLRRREAAAARERLALAEHAVRATGRQATQAAERAGLLRRAEAERAGWLEQHADLPAQERATARELAWRGRVDARAVALEQPGWLLAELGPMPPAEAPAGRAAWLSAAVELDTWRRTHGLDSERPVEQGGGERARAGRGEAAPASERQGSRPATERASAGEGHAADQAPAPGEARRGGPRWRHPDRERAARPEQPASEERTATVEALLGAEPSRGEPGRRRDWQQARAALERLAASRERTRDPDHHRAARHDRHRDHRRPERSPGPHERAER